MLCPLNCRGIQVAVGWPAAPHPPGREGEELRREGGTIHVVANKERRRARVRMIVSVGGGTVACLIIESPSYVFQVAVSQKVCTADIMNRKGIV